MNQLSSLDRYEQSLHATAHWLLRSIDKGKGGSCAHFSPFLGWSRPYPETTGYLIPTLLELGKHLESDIYLLAAQSVGRWLVSIQFDGGAWQGGLYNSSADGSPSVFNTGQIIKGMVALYRETGEDQWLQTASRAAFWLAQGVDEKGLWPASDYKAEETPSYYTHVAWPILEVWSLTGDSRLLDAAERFLFTVLDRRMDNGAFQQMGFQVGRPAFTHTIAYTLRGLLEAARLTGDWQQFGEPCVDAMEFFLQTAQLRRGRLPGAYDDQWQPQEGYSCLTGNAQLAICLLIWEQQHPDLRIVNGAARLVDSVKNGKPSPIPYDEVMESSRVSIEMAESLR